jgi:hypothetical protein
MEGDVPGSGAIERLVLATAPLAVWTGALLAVVLLGLAASPPVERRRRFDSLQPWTMALAFCLVWYAAVMMLTGGPLA